LEVMTNEMMGDGEARLYLARIYSFIGSDLVRSNP
jgi:hypothetical protein